jgi:hypothetical protein
MNGGYDTLNLTLCIDGLGLVYGTLPQWKAFISALSEGRAANYSRNARVSEESLTSLVNYLRRSYAPIAARPEPEAFGLRLNPITPSDGCLANQLLAA